MMRRTVQAAVAAVVCAALHVSAAAAQSDYCESMFGGAPSDRSVPGDCTQRASYVINGPEGPTSLRLLTDGRVDLGGRLLAVKRVIEQTADAMGPAMRRLGGVRLPPTVHVIVAPGALERSPSTNGQTFTQSPAVRSAEPHDCPIVLYNSAAISDGALRRTLAHELFHCIQYETFYEQALYQPGPAGAANWWTEGSAEWFEDFVFPGDVDQSSLRLAIQRFHELSGERPLTELTYANAVLFAWLANTAPSDVVSYMSRMAEPGVSQEEGFRRALSADRYTDFARAYVDDAIEFPSGVRVENAPIPTIGATRGEPDDDPDLERAAPAPLTLKRGIVEFTPGGYRPKGGVGEEESVFSERKGEPWGKVPRSLLVRCGERKRYRYAALPTSERPPVFKLKPGTDKATQCGDCGAVGPEVRRAGCVVGAWRLASGGNCDWIAGMSSIVPGMQVDVLDCEPGEADVVFHRDGTFGGTLRNVRRSVRVTFPTRGDREPPTGVMRNIIDLAKSEGQWLVTEETGGLRLCNTRTTGAGRFEIEGEEPTEPIPMNFGDSAAVNLRYACAGDSMTITVPTQSPMGDFSVGLERTARP